MSRPNGNSDIKTMASNVPHPGGRRALFQCIEISLDGFFEVIVVGFIEAINASSLRNTDVPEGV